MFLAPLIIFAVSGFSIVSMLGVKLYQQSSGIQLPFINKRNAVEAKIRQIEHAMVRRTLALKAALHPEAFDQITYNLRLVGRNAIKALENAFTRPGHWLDRRTRNLVSLIRGQQKLVSRGQPSTYLRSISRY